MTVVIAADEAGALDRAAAAVEQGAVIGVPTDTVYGLVCLCRDAAAIDRLFAVKERPSHKALPVLLGDAEQVRAVVRGAGRASGPGPDRALLAWPADARAARPQPPARGPHRRWGNGGRARAGTTVSARVGPSRWPSGLLQRQPQRRAPLRYTRGRAGPTGRPHPSPHRRRAVPPGPGQHRARPERTAAKTAARRADWPGSTGRSQDTRRSGQ